MKTSVIGLTIIVMATLIFPETIAQVGISEDNTLPHNTAMLDVKSTSKGFLPPRMTQAQIGQIESPADGLMVYCTTDSKLYIYSVTSDLWKEVIFGTGIIIPPLTCGNPVTRNHIEGPVAPVNKTVTYGTIAFIPGEPDKCWITQNLGADHQATAVDDATEESAGWYWQFNRLQGYKHDGTTRTPNTTWITSIDENSDWLITNDPCAMLLGNLWRLPTSTELTNVDATGGWTNWNGPWSSALKMHAAGYLASSGGSLNARGLSGFYWSINQGNGFTGWAMNFSSANCSFSNYNKAGGSSCRCIRDYTPSEWTCGYSITANHVTGDVAPVSKTLTYWTVGNIPGETSKCWIAQNLGADHQATAVNDATEESAGWYWQYNRMQGYKHDGTTRTPNTPWITSIDENSDWLTANDPCVLLLGTGWRLPTYTEWHNVYISGGWTGWNGPWSSALKLHAAGDLIYSDGSLYNRGTNGLYWSSNQGDNFKGWGVHFDNSSCGIFKYGKTYGFSARCLQDTASIEWACGNSITVSHVAGNVAPVTKTVTYGTANNIPGETSKCWITQNLGANHQATAVNDATEESAGWYWQFNRKQGHKHDGTTLIPSWTITVIDEDSDWLIANDPCALLLGSGWRLPTSTEWTNVDASGGWMNWTGPWNSALKMHAAGYLSSINGSLNIRGSYGYYWSSTQASSFNGSFLVFNSSYCDLDNDDKASGFSARCLRD